jgi:hypothetical protein
MLPAHGAWAAAVAQQTSQKTFRIAEGNDVSEVVLSVYPDQAAGAKGIPADEASSAEREGWAVSVAYKAAPDMFLFQRTFPTEREGRGAFDDLAAACAQVEGFVRQQKMDKAQEATAALMEKFKSNSGETPILPSAQA